MNIPVFHFPALQQPGIMHGCFSRHGGCSDAPWDSLNISTSCGDDKDNVMANRQAIASQLNCRQLMTLQQVHGDTIIIIDADSPADQQGDAMLTASPGIGLLIQQADCQSVMLYDPMTPAVANIHVGWRGNVAQLINKSVTAMTATFGSRPEHLQAAISPSLGPCCAQFINYQQELPADFLPFQVRPCYFDLWQISRWQLQQAGLLTDNISVAQICTQCNGDYFSYRRQPETGRCASIIGLRHG